MEDLLVIIPTRGRPQAVPELVTAWDDTGATAHLLFAVDTDDPELAAYKKHAAELKGDGRVRFTFDPRRRLCGTLNAQALSAAKTYRFLAFLGDDHRPRTIAWDQKFRDVLSTGGPRIVYGNDLLRSETLPTAVAMTSNIVTALGYMAPPDLVHLFLDNAWLDWGRGAECLTYLPGTVIEHMHPAAGKAANDAGYLEANSQTRFTADRDAYEQYTTTQLADDIKKLEALKE